jgi:hypothetical protein
VYESLARLILEFFKPLFKDLCSAYLPHAYTVSDILLIVKRKNTVPVKRVRELREFPRMGGGVGEGATGVQ